MMRKASQVAIIGAGPYGLSIAAHLKAIGIYPRVFGEPMIGWRRHMPVGMFLKSTFSASSLSAPASGFTFADFCGVTGLTPLDDGQPVPIDLFIRYGLWFQKSLIPEVEQVRVRQLARIGSLFNLTLEEGEEVQAEAVVVASGLAGFRHLPGELAAVTPSEYSATSTVSHSSQHSDFSGFTGRDVAVIGAGQSALETAALLQESGASVHVLIRGRRVLFGSRPPAAGRPRRLHRLVKPPSPLGPGWSLASASRAPAMIRYLPVKVRVRLLRSVLGPSGAWWLRDRVADRVDLLIGQSVVRASLANQRIVLQLCSIDGKTRELPVDHVIAATGYRVELNSLDFLQPDLRSRVDRVYGSPRLGASFESSVPGLFFTGLSAAATFGPLLRFVCGTHFAARRISASLAFRTNHFGRS